MTASSNYVLVTGGAGYIGSHVCKALAKAGYVPVTYDNLVHGHSWGIKWGPFVNGDLQDKKKLEETFSLYKPIAVIHLAAFINVRESQENPGKYYFNNIGTTLTLLEVMVKQNVKHLVFSSTAAVYGIPTQLPVAEDHRKAPINVYGKSKLMVEEILHDYFQSHGIASVSLRYFNAAGADPDGEIGEAHSPETHLIPLVIEASLQKKPLTIFGTDHPTEDGTAVRDYIHVSDLALAHIKALQWVLENKKNLALNLGTGKGVSILEVIKEVEKVSTESLEINTVSRFPHDPSILIADPQRANKMLQWNPIFSDIRSIVESAWSWHKKKQESNV